MKLVLCLALSVVLAVNASPVFEQEAQGQTWVLLCSGGIGWSNYAISANVYHAYQTVKKQGVPEKNIVVMHYDDLALNKANPTQGKIVNALDGEDVYAGVPKDYVGADVTPKNFLAILRGDPTLKAQGKKVIESGPNDKVFVYFMDHGSVGSVLFPKGYLYADELNTQLKKMNTDKKFAQLVFYLEACDSGSMFEKHLPTDINVYAITSSKYNELSWMCTHDTVRKTYLGGFFGVTWLNDSEANDPQIEILDKQYAYIVEHNNFTMDSETHTQHSQHYGDLSIAHQHVSEFLGPKKVPASFNQVHRDNVEYVNIRDVPIKLAEKNIASTDDLYEKQIYVDELARLLKGREYVDTHLYEYVNSIQQFTAMETEQLLNSKLELSEDMSCYKKFVDTFHNRCFNLNENTYAFGKIGVFNNICNQMVYEGAVDIAVEYLAQYCDNHVAAFQTNIE
ncbi:unnamed protein product [Medioppia subpectinata]|uniref:legumain n=1 Tax=Medioppia subpectinata TaxID=1979941 RepID=A0A7R9KSX7_9ACAR|nr:unnamed protein product [Medioppia subpectinata]CAG2108063.1 unnamed protein product [Medioppia subpectinata]